MDGIRLHVPEYRMSELAGSRLDPVHKPRQVRLLKEGTAERPQWYAVVFHAVPFDQVKRSAMEGVLGINRNAEPQPPATFAGAV